MPELKPGSGPTRALAGGMNVLNQGGQMPLNLHMTEREFQQAVYAALIGVLEELMMLNAKGDDYPPADMALKALVRASERLKRERKGNPLPMNKECDYIASELYDVMTSLQGQ